MSSIKHEGRERLYWKTIVLTIAGGVAFWLTNFAISLTQIAAEYRAALSISYLPMIVESLVSGLIIAFLVSYFLIRFYDRVPMRNSILKSVLLSLIALIIGTILIELPSSFTAKGEFLHYFLIGALFNVLRFLALGIIIGYLYTRMVKGLIRSKMNPRSPREA